MFCQSFFFFFTNLNRRRMEQPIMISCTMLDWRQRRELAVQECPCLLYFYQSGRNLNPWKTPKQEKRPWLFTFFSVNTLLHIALYESSRVQHTCLLVHPTNTQRHLAQHVYVLTGRNTSQRFSILHMRAIYGPSCLAGQRLMSWLLGTHILYACATPDHMFPSSLIGFSHFCRKAEKHFARVLR